jgi:hypothetical protein
MKYVKILKQQLLDMRERLETPVEVQLQDKVTPVDLGVSGVNWRSFTEKCHLRYSDTYDEYAPRDHPSISHTVIINDVSFRVHSENNGLDIFVSDETAVMVASKNGTDLEWLYNPTPKLEKAIMGAVKIVLDRHSAREAEMKKWHEEGEEDFKRREKATLSTFGVDVERSV